MNLFAPQHLIPILIIVLLLFGRGRISEFMGDFAKGIKSFKKGLRDDDDVAGEESASPVRGTLGAHEQTGSHAASGKAAPARRSSKGKS